MGNDVTAIPTVTILAADDINANGSEFGATSSDVGVVNQLQKMFGEMWYITVGVIFGVLMICILCLLKRYVTCYCGVKGKEAGTHVTKGGEGNEGVADTTEHTGIEMSDGGLEPMMNPNGKQYVQIDAQSPMSMSDNMSMPSLPDVDLANPDGTYPQLPHD